MENITYMLKSAPTWACNDWKHLSFN